jgi:hypothetical protein
VKVIDPTNLNLKFLILIINFNLRNLTLLTKVIKFRLINLKFYLMNSFSN